MDILNEAYMGSNPNLKKAEKYLEAIMNNATKDKRSYNSNDNKKFCEIMKKEFNFKEFELVVANTFDGPNAYTVPDSVGYLVEGQACAMVIFLHNLYVDANLTIEEAMAIILHEVGHAYKGGCHGLLALSTLDICIGTCVNPNIGLSRLIKIAYLNRMSQSFYSMLAKIKHYVTTLTGGMGDVIKRVHGNINSLIELIPNIRVWSADRLIHYMVRGATFADYAEERYADTFAASYGYGPALQRALEKLGRISNNTDVGKATNGSCLALIRDFKRFNMAVLLLPVDCHPNSIKRAMVMSAKLKRDLKRGDYPPKQKAELEKSIKEIDDRLEQMTDLSYRAENQEVFTFAFDYCIYNTFLGKIDPRDIASDLLKAEI